ncbi:dopamine receptor D2a [Mastacembelus armatus]|uniref:dopamine receptor D2a n=1 Tax=Mastacembelus armatus TaxID=205130 RepID=UPI000E459C94|nr:D(2) dopamine receptor [Mastacembelus armatus]
MDVITQYAYNDSFYDNGTWSSNETDKEQKHPYNYYAMLLTLLIFIIVFGNVLVCMAVSREKALQTTTNYLIVSLAVADLLVATLVMPWVVYLEVVGEWRFSKIHCDIFVTLDVMMCTASILNLCAISIDRYTAVAMPMLYNTRYSSRRRVTVMISVVWVLSFAISCPLLFGLNNTDESLCVIANPAFVVYSSIVSFYVPFIITLLVYVQIYVVLRKRRKRVNTKPKQRVCQPADPDVATSLKDKCTHPEDVRLCTVIVKSNGNFPVNKKKVLFIKDVVSEREDLELDELNNSGSSQKQKQEQQCVLADTPATSHQLLMPNKTNVSPTSSPTPADEGQKAEKNGDPTKEVLGDPVPVVAKTFQAQALPNGKTQTSVKTMSKRKISQQKEKKATQMLAIVLGVFIICWLPFFITHILNTHCTKCKVPAEMYNAFTWLGYVNSAVNPIIYTTFNIEFRKAFIKILHC